MRSTGDRKGNITAAFGSDLTAAGVTAVPNLLLKNYAKISITDSEMILLINLMYLQTATGQPFPDQETMAKNMSADEIKIKADLATLMEKGILGIEYHYCEKAGDVVPHYSFEPLYEKLSELWACEKVKAYQEMKKSLQVHSAGSPNGAGRKRVFTGLCKSFEREFGRLLSPLEIEQISAWLDDFEGTPDLVHEALKRAVLLGKHNFKYIDSILREWRRNNLKTVAEVATHEANFRQNGAQKSARSKPDRTDKKKDKFRLLYLS